MGRESGDQHLSRRFRKYGLAKFALAWAAVLLQLHLVFVLELHHHAADFPATPQSQRSAVAQATPVGRTSPLYCPVCQIARHSAAQPGTASSLVIKFPKEIKAPHSVKPGILSASLFIPAGRAPPLN